MFQERLYILLNNLKTKDFEDNIKIHVPIHRARENSFVLNLDFRTQKCQAFEKKNLKQLYAIMTEWNSAIRTTLLYVLKL